MKEHTPNERGNGGPDNSPAPAEELSSATGRRAFEFPLNPNHTAILLIDFQDGLLALSKTVQAERLRAATVRLIRLARLFDIPVVVSTALLDRPTDVTPDISEALGQRDHHVSGRSTANAFTHPPTASEIAGLGRKTLLLAGVLTEVMIQHTGLSGADRGYDVQVVVDACGALSSRTEDAALRRLVQAGVAITSSASIAAQLMGDLTQSPKAAEALKLLFEISIAA